MHHSFLIPPLQKNISGGILTQFAKLQLLSWHRKTLQNSILITKEEKNYHKTSMKNGHSKNDFNPYPRFLQQEKSPFNFLRNQFFTILIMVSTVCGRHGWNLSIFLIPKKWIMHNLPILYTIYGRIQMQNLASATSPK